MSSVISSRVILPGLSVFGLLFFSSGIVLSAQAHESSSLNVASAAAKQSSPILPPPPSSDATVESEPLLEADLFQGTIRESREESPELNVENSFDVIDASSVSINDYVLGAGDRLQVDVFESPEFSGEFEVFADGTIRMPFINAVVARGLTVDETSALLSRQYAPILRRPIVSIRVLESRPITLALSGEVNRPGSYRVSLEDTDGLPTVTQAIQLAGGITQAADIRSIQVRRPSSRSADPETVISVDLWKLLQDADLQQDIALQDGDRITISKAPVLFLDEAEDIASFNISPDSITVNVVGEVGSPGVIQVPPNTSLNEAILLAGGFTNRARRGRVDLVQLNPNGTITNREIDVDLSESPNDETNPFLRPNETVIVNRSTFTRVTDGITRALSPAAAVFSLFRIFD